MSTSIGVSEMTFWANISEGSVARSGHAIGEMSDILTAVDALLQVKTPSGRHNRPKVHKDFDCVVIVLTDEYVLKCNRKCQHGTFKNFASIRDDPKGKWLTSRRKAATIEYKIKILCDISLCSVIELTIIG